MNPLTVVLFGGQTRTKLKDLTKSKDLPAFLLNATDKLAERLAGISPLLGDLVYMEAGFLRMDGTPTANAAKRCRTFVQEECTVMSPRGDRLVGTLYKADRPTHTYVLCVHGYRMTAESEFARYIPPYHDMGYNVLAIHQTGAGLSEGKYVTFGLQESDDGLLWVQYLLEKDPEAQIFLHGDSLGAATVLLMTGKELPAAVKCCISDSAYVSAKAEFEYVLKSFHLPRLLYTLERKSFLKESGYDLDEADVLAAVKRSRTPTLFLHGERDVFVPPENCRNLSEACTAEHRVKLFPKASHCQSEYYYPEEYFREIGDFVQGYLN